MGWLQITLNVNISIVETVSEILSAIGAISVTFQDAKDQPLYEPNLDSMPLWKQTKIIGLFAGNIEQTKLKKQLDSNLINAFPNLSYQLNILEDQDWNRKWMADFKPMCFGKRLWICPSWCKPPEPKAINILLDPGLAFGTGTHPTTALCLKWLDNASNLSGQTWIDYGCGSGILAIAAAKLGAKSIWAVDHDPQALQATQDNSIKNEINNIQTALPKDLPNIKADGILANILANPLIDLAETFAVYLNKNAVIVLSGILKEQVEAVSIIYQNYFKIVEIVEQENWVRIVAHIK
ncbi:MAG: 50S ribosomal protein L11 methyltransferase [Thiomargarita sp.]|nr:50S ribosomal protein L11 methyltransferase [Thiomargarita sp.]